MLEIPVNTCNVTYKPIKKKRARGRKKIDGEQIKRELMEKVNVSVDLENIETLENQDQVENETKPLENTFLLKEELIELCKKNLAAYSVPKEFEFRKSLPKTMIGKVDFRKLQQENAEKRAEERYGKK